LAFGVEVFDEPVIGNVKNDLLALGTRSQHHDSEKFKHRLHDYFLKVEAVLRVNFESKNLSKSITTS
jgi:hypothetical protein